MDKTLEGKTIALLATDGFEDSELTVPMKAVTEAGATVIVVSDDKETITGKDGTKIQVHKTVDETSADEFDGLLLPGGVANPDTLRMNEGAVTLIADFFKEGKPVAAICHAPWLLIEADVVAGRKLTSWPSLRTDLINAGADWVDEPVVVDEGLVTSRKPDDLEQFCAKAVEEFSEGAHRLQTA